MPAGRHSGLFPSRYVSLLFSGVLALVTGAAVAKEPPAAWKTVQQEVATLVSGGQFEKAQARLSEFITANPDFGPAYERRAWVMLDWLDVRDEFALTDVPLRRRPIADPASGLGNVDPPLEARRAFLEDRLYEKYAPPAEIKSVLNDMAECRRVSGKSFDPRPMEAFIAEFVGDADRARELIGTRCADGTATPHDYLTQSRILRGRRDLHGALAEVEKAWKFPETRSQAWSRKITLLRLMNRNKEASDAFDQWEDATPRDVRFLNTRIAITLDKKQVFKDFEILIGMMPQEASLYYANAVRDIQYRNDAATCMTHLDRAIELNPKSLIPYYARSNLKIKLGDLKGALADATAAIKCSPYFDLSYQVRSRILLKQGNTEAAKWDDHHKLWLKQLYALNTTFRSQPDNPEAAYALGRHYAKAEDWAPAVRNLNTCLHHAPRHVEALRQRCAILVTAGKMDLALADANSIVDIAPEPASYSLRGDVYAKRQEWDSAVEDYERIKSLDDRLEQALRKRAAWHKAGGRVEQARADLDRAEQASQAVFIAP